MAANDMNLHTAAARKVQDVYGVPGLLVALESPLPNAKVQAARFLRLNPDPRARTPLLRATHDPDPHVRGWAAFALSVLPSPEVEARLRELERDTEPVARNFVVSVKWWKSRDASSERVITLPPDLPSACPSIRRVL